MTMKWEDYRQMALAMTREGFIPVYGDFCDELGRIIAESINQAGEYGRNEITFLIDSNGGSIDCFATIEGAMVKSGLRFNAFISGARSGAFRLVQLCQKRVAT